MSDGDVKKEAVDVVKKGWLNLGKKGKIIAAAALGTAAVVGGAAVLSERRQRFADAQEAKKRNNDLPGYGNGDEDILAPVLRDGPLGPSYKGPGKG